MRAMDSGTLRSLVVRLAIAVPVVLVLFQLAWSTGIAVVIASIVVPAIVFFGIFLGVPLAGVIGERAVRLLGSDEGARPRPSFSRGEALVLAERFDEAIDVYRAQAEEFPREAEIWGRLFELTAVKLGDVDRARALHDEAKEFFDRPETRTKLDARYLQQIARDPRGADDVAFERVRLEDERRALDDVVARLARRRARRIPREA